MVRLAGRADDGGAADHGDLHRDRAHRARCAVDQHGVALCHLEQVEHAQRRLGRDWQRRRGPLQLGRLRRHGGGQRVLGVASAVGEAQHLVADSEPVDSRPHLVNCAGDLQAQHSGQLRGEHLLGRPGSDLAVDRVHADGPHPHPHLPSARFRQLPVAHVENVQVREVERCEGVQQRPVELRHIVLDDVVEGVAGRDPDAGAPGPDLLGDGRGDLDGEADPVWDRAAVAVGAPVGVAGEELLQEVAVGPVDLHAVRAGGDRSRRRAAEVPHGVGDLLLGEARGSGISWGPEAVNI